MSSITLGEVSAALFALALLHTFATGLFNQLARRYPRHGGLLHLLGEVEVVFGFWALVLVAVMAAFQGRGAAVAYLEQQNFTEPLFVFVGTGCQTVSRSMTRETDFVTGVWKDGRVGTYRGIHKGKAGFGATVFGTKSIAQIEKGGGYEDLCLEIARFFKTRKSPVNPEETIEIFAFMEAADESKRQGGAPVALAEVLAKAKTEAVAKLKN